MPIQCSGADVGVLKAKKFCNEYHILGKCSFENATGRGCSFQHGARLKGNRLEALRFVARLSACPYGLNCMDPECILGHQCPKEPCKKGQACFFPAYMHGVDTRIVAWDA